MTRVVSLLLGSQGSGSAPREPRSAPCHSRWSGTRKMECAYSRSPALLPAVSNRGLVGVGGC